jgi:hypothetical protein
MKRTTHWTVLGLLATVAAAAFSPASALADSRQDNKNFWRNGAILGGAAALYGLHNHDTTTTVLGAAGAAYSAKRYEDDRHSQSQAQAARDRRARYHRIYANSYGAPYRSYSSRSYHTTRYYHTTGYSHPYYSSFARSHSSRARRSRVCHCPR